MPALGYSRWENFKKVILNASNATARLYDGSNYNTERYFRKAKKLTGASKGRQESKIISYHAICATSL